MNLLFRTEAVDQLGEIGKTEANMPRSLLRALATADSFERLPKAEYALSKVALILWEHLRVLVLKIDEDQAIVVSVTAK